MPAGPAAAFSRESAVRAAHLATALICAYETASIVSRRMPMVSQLCRRCPALKVAIVAGLALHLYLPAPGHVKVTAGIELSR